MKTPPTNPHFSGSPARRDFLRVGCLGFAGLSLPELLRARASGTAAAPSTSKAVIMVYLAGGPSHIDMYDLKPDAPVEFRGPFKPIQTNVPGMNISELMPQQAKIADKIALIRNMKFHCTFHQPFELLTGIEEPLPKRMTVANSPDFGAKVSYLRKAARVKSPMPPYVALTGLRKYYDNKGETNHMSSYPAFLGSAYDAFHSSPIDHSKSTKDSPYEIADNNPVGLQNLTLNQGISRECLDDRAALLRSFDDVRRDLDNAQGSREAVDAFHAQALEMLASGKVRDAFDLNREPERNRARYGKWGEDYLLARRLVEAGAPIVTLNPGHSGRVGSNGSWDHHGDVKGSLTQMAPEFDQGLSALISDLYDRGLHQDVTVVVWGEMGRTPKLNNNGGGRDHWPGAGFTLLAGGGFSMGQVIGATDARGGQPKGHAYRPKDVLATLYQFLGYPPDQTTIPDLQGRPVHLVDGAVRINELF